MDYGDLFAAVLADIKKDNIYRNFVTIERNPQTFPRAFCVDFEKEVTVWCSNDYLCQGVNSHLIEIYRNAVLDYGLGSGGTRNISGTSSALVRLETKLANLYHKDQALVFGSAFITNEYSISVLARLLPNCVLISDQYNHASMIMGIKKYRVDVEIFNHNDIDHLEKILSKHPRDRYKILLFESLYSMNGTIAPIQQMLDLAKNYNALTYIDEVHAVALYGDKGLGICEKLGLIDQVDIIQGSFAKGYGAIGGYVVASRQIIEVIRLKAQGFIFSTSIPPANAETICHSIDYVIDNPELRLRFFRNVDLLRSKLKINDIEILNDESHIIAVMIRNSELCNQIAQELITNYDIYIAPINFPTVLRGNERLRIIVTVLHTEEMMDHLVKALVALKKKYSF